MGKKICVTISFEVSYILLEHLKHSKFNINFGLLYQKCINFIYIIHYY